MFIDRKGILMNAAIAVLGLSVVGCEPKAPDRLSGADTKGLYSDIIRVEATRAATVSPVPHTPISRP